MPIHRKACDRSNLDNIKVVPQGYLSFAAYHYHFSDSCLWFGPSSIAVWPTFWWSIAHIWYPPWLLDDSRESHPSLIVSLQIGWSKCFWLRQGSAGQALSMSSQSDFCFFPWLILSLIVYCDDIEVLCHYPYWAWTTFLSVWPTWMYDGLLGQGRWERSHHEVGSGKTSIASDYPKRCLRSSLDHVLLQNSIQGWM